MNLRTLSSVLLATMAAVLWAYSVPASATVVLTEGGEIYTGTIKAEAEGSIKVDGTIVTTCGKSTIEGAVESHGAEVLTEGKVSSLSFSECGSGTVTVVKPGTFEVNATSEDNGTLSLSGAEITVLTHNILGTVHCIYAPSKTSIGTLTGSITTESNATLEIGSSGIPEKATDTSACKDDAVLTGSYKVTSPSTLAVTAEQAAVLSVPKEMVFTGEETTQKIRIENISGNAVKIDVRMDAISFERFSTATLCDEETLAPVTKPTENFCDELVECRAGSKGTQGIVLVGSTNPGSVKWVWLKC